MVYWTNSQYSTQHQQKVKKFTQHCRKLQLYVTFRGGDQPYCHIINTINLASCTMENRDAEKDDWEINAHSLLESVSLMTSFVTFCLKSILLYARARQWICNEWTTFTQLGLGKKGAYSLHNFYFWSRSLSVIFDLFYFWSRSYQWSWFLISINFFAQLCTHLTQSAMFLLIQSM